MTNNNAAQANKTAYPKMTRSEMQDEATAIGLILTALEGIFFSNTPEDCCALVEMAQKRAENLSSALDSINMDEAVK